MDILMAFAMRGGRSRVPFTCFQKCFFFVENSKNFFFVLFLDHTLELFSFHFAL